MVLLLKSLVKQTLGLPVVGQCVPFCFVAWRQENWFKAFVENESEVVIHDDGTSMLGHLGH